MNAHTCADGDEARAALMLAHLKRNIVALPGLLPLPKPERDHGRKLWILATDSESSSRILFECDDVGQAAAYPTGDGGPSDVVILDRCSTSELMAALTQARHNSRAVRAGVLER